MRQSTTRQNWGLAIAVILLAVLPLVFVRGKFEGADGQVVEAIQDSHPTYEPWFEPIFEPASAEVESLLFVAQAALGAGVIGYAIGLYKGRSQSK
jgi:cobalt/nickel transport protein